MKTVAILSGKGGTGKSSISTSLAYILAHCGFRTLLVDLDLFTHGLTYYALANYQKEVKFSLSDIFFERDTQKLNSGRISFLRLPSTFTNAELYVLPSISEKNRTTAGLHFKKGLNDILNFRNLLSKIVQSAVVKHGFDYVLIDTRGGTDHTSIGAALAAKSYIIVTEADKPSWDMGSLLIETIGQEERRARMYARKVGFIINKNILPSTEIESFLEQKWKAPHLGTIPFDKNTIRCFQDDRVPVVEDIGCPFSQEVLGVVRRAFLSRRWTDSHLARLKKVSRPKTWKAIVNMIRD